MSRRYLCIDAEVPCDRHDGDNDWGYAHSRPGNLENMVMLMVTATALADTGSACDGDWPGGIVVDEFCVNEDFASCCVAGCDFHLDDAWAPEVIQCGPGSTAAYYYRDYAEDSWTRYWFDETGEVIGRMKFREQCCEGEFVEAVRCGAPTCLAPTWLDQDVGPRGACRVRRERRGL